MMRKMTRLRGHYTAIVIPSLGQETVMYVLFEMHAETLFTSKCHVTVFFSFLFFQKAWEVGEDDVLDTRHSHVAP